MTEDDFSDPANKEVFFQIRRLIAEHKPIDPTMIVETSADGDVKSFLEYVIALRKMGAPWHAKRYAKDLHELGEKRRLHRFFREGAMALENGDDMHSVMDRLRQQMRSLGKIQGRVQHMPQIASTMMDRMEAARSGEIELIQTGIPDLDNLICGLAPGELDVVGARPAVGKSAFGIALALAAARAGKKVLVCSCEMSDVQYAQRVMSEITGINSKKLRTGDLSDSQWVAVGDALNEMARLKVGFTFDVKYVEDLYSVCTAEADEGGIDLLVVDYIQIMDTRERCENENIRITRISGKLKRLALDLQIPVLALAQVNRQEGTTDRMPNLKELRGSGSLEQDADKVLFLHRVEAPSDPYCTSAEALKRFKADGDQMVAINVAKQRDGETGSFPVRFVPRRMQYKCLTRRESS
jgi:replicative DNA helicase